MKEILTSYLKKCLWPIVMAVVGSFVYVIANTGSKQGLVWRKQYLDSVTSNLGSKEKELVEKMTAIQERRLVLKKQLEMPVDFILLKNESEELKSLSKECVVLGGLYVKTRKEQIKGTFKRNSVAERLTAMGF